MRIRKATLADARDIKSVHYHAWTTNYRGYTPDEYLDSMKFDNKSIQEMTNYMKEDEFFVAEENGRVIGFTELKYPDDKTVEIGGLYVHPDFQKMGAGSALMKKVCQMKKKLGYDKLILWTIKDGPSLGFYAKQGLKPSCVPEKKHGPFIAIQLEKNLVLDTTDPQPIRRTSPHSRS